MKIVITLLVIFIISALLMFTFIYKENRQEPHEEKMGLFMTIFVTVIIALILTVVIGLILFVLIGSANTVNILFSLNINMNQIIILAIAFLVYLYTIDTIIEIVIQHILGKNIFSQLILFLIRILTFHIIGSLISLNEKVSFTIASGVAFIILVIEGLYNLREKNKLHKLNE